MVPVIDACRRRAVLRAVPSRAIYAFLFLSLLILATLPAYAANSTGKALGEQRTLVAVVNFQDNAGTASFSVEQVEERVFGTVGDFYLEASYGKAWLTGETMGWITLPMASTCDTDAIRTATDAAIETQGVDLSAYGRFVYVFDSDVSCGWQGFSTITAYPSASFLVGFQAANIFAHEIGHGFGLHHANIVRCSDGVQEGDCKYNTGERFDVMGGAAQTTEPKHFSALNKERLGWLETQQIQTVSESGTYLIEPLEVAEGAYPKMLKILKEVDPATGVPYWYYIEYRQAIGFDAQLADYPNVMNGVLMRYAVAAENLYDYLGDTLLSTRLLDLNPNSHYLISENTSDPALEPGQSYTEANAGFTITTLWADGATAGVQIDFEGAAACVYSAPGLTAETSTASGNAGAAVDYTISVQNLSSAGCPVAAINLDSSVPAGWQGEVSPSAVSLASGESATVVLTVTSPVDASGGDYALNVSAAAEAAPGLSGSEDLVYSVSETSGNRSPVANDDVASVSKGASVRIAVLANDNDPDGDTLIVKSVGPASEGTVSVNADGSITYYSDPRQKRKGSFTYVVSDGIAQATASVTVNLEKASGGGGGGKGAKNR